MKSKRRIRVAAVMVIILSSLSFWMISHNGKGTIRKELFDFAVADTASISKIYMANTGGKQITIEKEKPGEWKVNGKFKARTEAVKNLLTCIKDLQVRNPVAKSAIENISKQMATSSTKIEIYNGENLIKTYYVGSDTQDGLGTFMLLVDAETGENSTLPFVMFIPGFNGFLSVRYFMDEDLWRDRSIFSFYPDQISSISVEYTRYRDSSFTIYFSDKNEISIADSKGANLPSFDTLKAKRYITYYSNIQYDALKNQLRDSFKDSVIAKGPVHIIKLKDRKGKIHVVKTFSKQPDNPGQIDEVTGKPIVEDLERMFVLINDDKDFALIQYYVFGKLFIGISYFKTPVSSDKAIGVKK
ncbi:MAG: hypothetical protein HY841_06850 [Bacteroidetes bacterium]|nr:hypothetical protein [Bacteroidota bacterium]